MSNIKGMILAAGLGSRLKPWTDQHPKALAVVNGKSLLQRNIEYFQQYGITEVIVNVHHFADQIIRAIQENNGWGSTITISDETDAVLETGGGLQKAGWYFTDDFVLMNVDILTNLDLHTMMQQHQQDQSLATLAVSDRVSSRYFLFNADRLLSGWKNTNTGEEKIMRNNEILIPKAFSGIHIIHPDLLMLMPQKGKFSMVDVYLSLCAEHPVRYFDHTHTKFIDVGKPESVLQAAQMFA